MKRRAFDAMTPVRIDCRNMQVSLGWSCRGGWPNHGPLAGRNDESTAPVSGQNEVENGAPLVGAIGHE
jgi:hypothetical protein